MVHEQIPTFVWLSRDLRILFVFRPRIGVVCDCRFWTVQNSASRTDWRSIARINVFLTQLMPFLCDSYVIRARNVDVRSQKFLTIVFIKMIKLWMVIHRNLGRWRCIYTCHTDASFMRFIRDLYVICAWFVCRLHVTHNHAQPLQIV